MQRGANFLKGKGGAGQPVCLALFAPGFAVKWVAPSWALLSAVRNGAGRPYIAVSNVTLFHARNPNSFKTGVPRPCLPLVVSRHRRSLDQRRNKGGGEAVEFPTTLDGASTTCRTIHGTGNRGATHLQMLPNGLVSGSAGHRSHPPCASSQEIDWIEPNKSRQNKCALPPLGRKLLSTFHSQFNARIARAGLPRCKTHFKH